MVELQPDTNKSHKVEIGVGEISLPTGDSLKGDWIVFDIASSPSGGNDSNIFEYFERKSSDSSDFFRLVTDLSCEHPPATEFCPCTPLHHRSQMGLFGERNRLEEPVILI